MRMIMEVPTTTLEQAALPTPAPVVAHPVAHREERNKVILRPLNHLGERMFLFGILAVSSYFSRDATKDRLLVHKDLFL